jgi:lantibiotic modifying enzyme
MFDKITEKIHEIAGVLKKHLNTQPASCTLLSGKIGISLFFIHYARFTGVADDQDYAFEILPDLIDGNYDIQDRFSYSAGIAGLGWLLEHINSIEFAEVDSKDSLSDFDEYLCEKMCSEIASYHYDFLHGGLGTFYYLINRKQEPIIIESLLSAIDELRKTSIEDDQKMSWFSYDYKTRLPKIGEHNLGLAHGNPAILSVLCSAHHKVPALREHVEPIIRKTTNFIIWCFKRNLNSNEASYFPYTYGDDHAFVKSRLGWCYGDLGIALSLRSANSVLNDPSIDEIINKILYKSTLRRSASEAQLNDAGLCHGTAGVAHIYNSFYKDIKSPYLKEAADYWFAQSQENAKFQDGPAGFKSFRYETGYIDTYGFLEGIAGIGLAYISYLTNDFSWDKSLLISI